MSKAPSYAVSGPERERLVSAFSDSGTSGPIRVQTEDGVVELPAAATEASGVVGHGRRTTRGWQRAAYATGFRSSR
jgi:hypothetical protein